MKQGMGYRHSTAAIALAAFTAVSGVSAQPASPEERPRVSSSQIRYAQALHLAYVRTPSAGANEESRVGVSALAAFLNEKTSITPAGVAGIDIENDDISLFPFIYWQISPATKPLSDKAQTKLQAYLNTGGLILFDLRGSSPGAGEPKILRDVLGRVRLRPVVRMPDDHKLVQSFYKLPGLSGSNNNGSIRIESPDAGRGPTGALTSSVIIGERNWAAAWAASTVQRDSSEHLAALRAGANMVTYALTGTHKSNIVPDKAPKNQPGR